MTIIQAIILGIIQGLTEFIPISSSGHLILVHEWLGVTTESLIFDVALHLGTLIALVIYFYKDIYSITKSLFVRDNNTNLAMVLAVATVPAVIAGFFLQDLAESSFRSVRLVSLGLIIVALLMLWAESYSKKLKQKTKLQNVSARQGVLIGIAQAVALIPGVSRSGATITTGLFAGVERKDATRFSFLLGIPITFGAVLKVFSSSGTLDLLQAEQTIFIVGVLSAFLSGIFAIQFMLKYLAKHTLNVFAYYRIVVGIVVLLLTIV